VTGPKQSRPNDAQASAPAPAGGVYSLKDSATGEQREVSPDAIIEAVRALFRD
jgi:hypothetical protein